MCGLLVCGGQQLLGLQRLPYEYNRNTFVMARKHQNVALIRLDAQNVPPTGIIDKITTLHGDLHQLPGALWSFIVFKQTFC